MKKESDRYLKIVEWSEDDQCYVGTCPRLMIGGVHGKNEAKVYKELCEVVDEWIKIYKKEGKRLPNPTINKEYSGKFILRTGEKLHKRLAIAALKQGDSLNAFCTKLLEKIVA